MKKGTITELYKFHKAIMEMYKDNPKIVESILGLAIIERAKEIELMIKN